MKNEIVFLIYIFVTSTASLFALKFGKEVLIALICIQCILVNLFVTKEITLLGLSATSSDALAVGTTFGLNLLQEYFQRPVALKTIWISFGTTIFYTILCLLHLSYIPAISDISNIHFKVLLTPMPRLVFASLFVYLIVQHIDCRLYGYFCKRFEFKKFIFRNYVSVAITQLIDTILFSFLGLYGLNKSFSSLLTIGQIIIVSYTIKIILILITAPYLFIAKKLIKL